MEQNIDNIDIKRLLEDLEVTKSRENLRVIYPDPLQKVIAAMKLKEAYSL